MQLPEFLLQLGDQSVENRAWLESLPSMIKDAEEKWALKVGSPYIEYASCSFVAPCKVKKKGDAVLKIGLPHEEALHEIDGLALLEGRPTVKLLACDRKNNTMLLERCMPGSSLKREPAAFQDEAICRLLPEIWQAILPAGAPFRPLAAMVAQWNREAYQQLGRFPDPDLARKGCRLKEKLIESTEEQVLLATDLHAGNILRAQRRPWLVIDIKPYLGDPTYDLTQHLLNGLDRLSAYPDATIKRLAGLAGLDAFRLRAWMVARLASEQGGKHQALARKLSKGLGGVWQTLKMSE